MQKTKFTLNAFVLVVMIFSAIALFFTVKMTNLADRSAVNTFAPIEGTSLAVRYSSLEKSGICRGNENMAEVLIPGTFGYDWGAAAIGNTLYINEYTSSNLGMMVSRLVKINTDTMEKEVLLKDTMLRGRCRSGELVCVSGFLMPSNYPEINALCHLYQLASPQDSRTTVLWLDPQTGETVYTISDVDGAEVAVQKKYLNHTLQEVRG